MWGLLIITAAMTNQTIRLLQHSFFCLTHGLVRQLKPTCMCTVMVCLGNHVLLKLVEVTILLTQTTWYT